MGSQPVLSVLIITDKHFRYYPDKLASRPSLSLAFSKGDYFSVNVIRHLFKESMVMATSIESFLPAKQGPTSFLVRFNLVDRYTGTCCDTS